MLALAAILAAAVPVPADVQDYYRDHNFVSAFSTVGERQLVAQARRPPASRRMTRVAAAMKRLAQRIEDVDPGIVSPVAPATEHILREDILRVTSFEGSESKGEAWVRLEALRLDHPARLMLISRFEDLAAADRRPSVDDLVVAGGRLLVATEEIHRWLWIDGEWRRDRATRHFLGYSPHP